MANLSMDLFNRFRSKIKPVLAGSSQMHRYNKLELSTTVQCAAADKVCTHTMFFIVIGRPIEQQLQSHIHCRVQSVCCEARTPFRYASFVYEWKFESKNGNTIFPVGGERQWIRGLSIHFQRANKMAIDATCYNATVLFYFFIFYSDSTIVKIFLGDCFKCIHLPL